MPELPEVETIVNDLRPVILGREVLDVQVFNERSLMGEADLLRGAGKVRSVGRRGKFIVISFEQEILLCMHLRMSGRILVRDQSEPMLDYERVRIDFEGASLRFCDIRKFGRVYVFKSDEYEEQTGICKLGVEPLGEEFSFERFLELVGKRRGNIKRLLLDQSLVAGIGNIYADEALFYAGIRPDKTIESIKKREMERLHGSIVRALKQGVKNRGTSISDFEDAYGRNGFNQEILYVYGRGGLECLNCKTTLVKTRVASRGTVYCPSCQK